MHCTNCGKEASQEDKFCGKCGKPLNEGNSASGDGSVNIAGNNKIKNSSIHVGDIYKGEKPEDTAYIDRTYVKPISIAGSPVKVSWFIVSGAVGFIGSFASIYSVFGSSWQFLFVLFAAISVFLLMNGILLWRTRISRLKWFNLESNKESEVFLTKIGGTCPKCDGVLKLTDIKIAENQYKTFVRCTRNSDHIWNFDPTEY